MPVEQTLEPGEQFMAVFTAYLFFTVLVNLNIQKNIVKHTKIMSWQRPISKPLMAWLLAMAERPDKTMYAGINTSCYDV